MDGLSVLMPVMGVRVMRMLVHHRFVPVPVLVGFVAVPREIVLVAMMGVVNMAVAVFHRLMDVFVLVVLGEMQPYPCSHQCRSHPKDGAGRFTEHGN